MINEANIWYTLYIYNVIMFIHNWNIVRINKINININHTSISPSLLSKVC